MLFSKLIKKIALGFDRYFFVICFFQTSLPNMIEESWFQVQFEILKQDVKLK